ncbi:MAG: TIGR04219 family outer membrane beta-barrel protein [Thermodesulfovibrionales bacterium]|nr:TIGR04219 family outer membrane beta-barrel protein [Thermodesulfovibrionales bacterium]
MKVFKGWGMAFLLSFILIPQVASATGLEAAIGFWNQDPQGDIAYKGESLSLEENLKYSDKTRFFCRAKIDMPLMIPNIYLMATPMKFDGTGSKDVKFTFGDKTFTGNVPFTSELRVNHYDIAFYYGLPFVKTATLGKLNVDAGLNLRIIDLKAEITQAPTCESKSFALPMPMVYLGAQVRLVDKLSLEAEIRGIAYSSNHYYDLIGRAKYKVFGPAFLGAGYRYEDIKIDYKDVKANVRVGGPFAEVGVEF